MDEEPLTQQELERLKVLLIRLIGLSRDAGPDHPLTTHAELTLTYVDALLAQSA